MFPVGLGGLPTFMDGGNPAGDALKYWMSIRRALLRAPVDRIGLGGYLSLTIPFPEFNDCIADIAKEFRQIKSLHQQGSPACLKQKIGVLTAWGKLRSWTCSGHLHENPENDLINVIESLSGLPFDVEFIGFDEINQETLKRLDVIINAGFAGSAWSGGENWIDDNICTLLTKWVHDGGIFLGVNAPSALEGFDTYLRMAHVLGVDIDTGARVNHGRWLFEVEKNSIIPVLSDVKPKKDVYLTDGNAKVLKAENNFPCVTKYAFGKGYGIYISSYRHSMTNARMLLNLLTYEHWKEYEWIPENENVDGAFFKESNTMVLANSCNQEIKITVKGQDINIKPYGLVIC
jgi:beta-D-galactosyl-(1->4)-L-rhamnose phosphorylase